MKKLFILIVLLTITISTTTAQEKKDTVFFMNGEILTGKVHDTIPGFIFVTYLHKQLPKETKIETDRLFSVKYANDSEHIYYLSDTLIDNAFSKEETRLFITGERDANAGYRPKLAAPIGFLVGAISPVFLPAILSPVPSLAYTGIVQLPKVKVNTEKIPHKENLKQYYYLLGYERVARKKLFFRTLIGCAIGLVGGYTYTLVR